MKYGSLAASARQRLMQYAPYLAANGVTIEYLPLLDNGHMERVAAGEKASRWAALAAYVRRLRALLTRRDFDVVWVQYELFPYLPGFVERLVSRTGKRFIVDYDDAIFHMYDANPRPAVRRVLGSKLAPLLRSADAVICGNTYIEAYARTFCDRTVVIPTVVDIDIFRPANQARSSGPLVVGWIGSPSTWAHVEPLLPRLLPLLERQGATMRVVGAGPRARGLPSVDSVEWTEASEVGSLQAMDIGIMPVADDPWSRGKCGYKLVQYMACGLPVVASPVGVNREIVIEGENGFLAHSPEEWEKALVELLGDAGLRDRMGVNGRRRAVERYSLQSQQARLLEVFRSLSAT